MRVEGGTRCKKGGFRKPRIAGGTGWELGAVGGGHRSVVTASQCADATTEDITNSHPTKFTRLIKREDTKGERDGNRFYDFCDMRNLFLWGGGNWVEQKLYVQDRRNSLTVLKNSKCKTSVIKSLKIAYISGLTKKRKIGKSGQGSIYQFPND